MRSGGMKPFSTSIFPSRGCASNTSSLGRAPIRGSISVLLQSGSIIPYSIHKNIILPRRSRVEGQDCGQRQRHVGRACVVLACHGAGHHADPLSTGRREDLPRSALEEGARWHDQATAQFSAIVFDHILLSRTGNMADRTSHSRYLCRFKLTTQVAMPIMTLMAARSPRKHAQQNLFRRGGKRRGAGRKPAGARAGQPHGRRPDFKASQPLHVTMRVMAEVGSLRRRTLYKAMRNATITAALRERIRIVHVSLQRSHVHMLVEADNRQALARGMQGFQVSAARHINTALGDGARRRRGKVFADRYHTEVITSPTQARNSIRYVLSNWRRHKEDREGLASTWLVDPFSTGILFPDWLELQDRPWMWPIRDSYDPLVVRRPESWLLREGWTRGGGPISARDVPSQWR